MMDAKNIGNPFPGLRPFETDEYGLFFGREGQSDALIERLQRSHFLAVVGTSGSGKSSLVRAGLLPALRGGMMAGAGSGWRIAIMRPGSDPIGNLAEALAEKGVLLEAGGGLPPAEAQAVIEATLRRGSLGLVDATRQARLEQQKLLVVVDQFEELFRFRAARTSNMGDDASAFVKLLLEAAQQSELPIYIVPTMRSDFLGDCAQFQGLPEAINDGQYLIPRMTRDERRFAITGPVGVTRGKITEPLVNRLMNDVGDNPDQLPILQHALMRTWDYWAAHHRNGEPIGLEHYEAVGTMADALSIHADEAFNELPNERSRMIAESLFKTLTERGADNREIRRPTCLKDICAIAAASVAEVVTVVDVFRGGGRSFLMPPAGVSLQPETVVDISHESLIRNWARLKEWVRDEAEAARIYRRLAEAAIAYRSGEGGLLDDVTLQWVFKWRDRYAPTRAWAVRYHPEFEEALRYLDESSVARDAAVAERERQREEQIARERRELEQAQLYAEQQHRAAQRMRRFTFALVLISLIAFLGAGAAVVAFAHSRKSEAEARQSEALAQGLANQLKQTVTNVTAAREEARQRRDEAVVALDRARQEETKAQDERKHAEAEKARANEQAAIAKRNADQALDAARVAKTAEASAEENARQVTNALERGELIRSGLESSRRGNIAQAQAAFQALKEKLKRLQPGSPDAYDTSFTRDQLQQFVDDYGWTLSHLADTYHEARDFESAIEIYEQAREILESASKSGSRPILFETYHGLAHSYHDNAVQRSDPNFTGPSRLNLTPEAQFQKAEQFYTKALDYQKSQAGGDPLVTVSGYKNLAQLYIDIGKPKEAEDNLKLVVDAYKTVEYKPGEGTVGALKDLAEFYRGQGRHAEAAQTYNELIDVQQEISSGEEGASTARALADNYGELGQIYAAMKDETRADNAFQLADKLQEVIVNVKRKGNGGLTPDSTNITYDNDLDELGDLYLKLERTAQALRSYETAMLIRKEVNERKPYVATSYSKLAHLYDDHYPDKTKAVEYYKLLIEATKDSKGQAAQQYFDGLKGLGVLYAVELNQPAEAEALLNRALTVSDTEQIAWDEESQVYQALLNLYRGQQNKQPEIEKTYLGKLDAIKRATKYNSYRTNTYPLFMADYFTTIAEVAAFYLERKDFVHAEEIYRTYSEGRPPFISRLNDLKKLDEMAAAMEKCQGLLRQFGKPEEAAKLDAVVKQTRERQKEVEAKQKENEATPKAP
ncbi:MAG TPA: hypothetical protein VGO56_18430 [Pyrinomonadaceae bacterium]|jgi:hypothetical protein|nr:hypothetical protein [Pyrinomonadaceae bacterium]